MNRTGTEGIVVSLAARQHGVVTRRQLLAAGLSSHHVEHRLDSGLLVRLHRGVYRVGPVESPRAREMGAILACGDGAVLSHESAARLLGLKPGAASSKPIHLGRPGGYRRRPGLRVHRLPTLRPGDVTRVDGIPTTTAARTLWDLAGTGSPRALERAFAVALDRGLVRRAELARLVARHRGAPGSRRLQSMLEAGPALTRSEAEERFLGLVRAAELPEPQANTRVEGLEVDFYWPGRGLVVEVDGYAYHGSPAAFQKDRDRDGRLVAAGRVVIRFTWRQIDQQPLAVIARVAQALAGPRDG